MQRTSSVAVVVGLALGLASSAAAQDCSVPRATRYPVAGPVNGGWDRTLEALHEATYDCEGTWSNSDYVGSGSGAHHGNDFFAAYQTPIVAVTDGVVAKAGWETGLGNRVAIHDACGWEYDAGHLDSIAPGIAVGSVVHAGEVLGFMGATGANSHGVVHLHFNVHFAANAWADDTDPFAVVGALASSACLPVGAGAAIEGWLDAADCTLLGGWARDRAHPDVRIAAGITVDGARFDVAASVDRADLCAPLGACNYAFEMFVPRSFLDGAAHEIGAVGASGGLEASLTGAPVVLTCPPPALEPSAAAGVRRYVPAAAFAAWRFDGRDVMTVSDAALAEYAPGRDWPSEASLVRADGEPAVYALDGGTRRWITSGRSLVAGWHMGWDVVRVTSAAEVAGYAEAGPMPERPFLVRGSGPEVFLLDVPTGEPPTALPDAAVADAASVTLDGGAPVADAGVGDAAVLGGDGGAPRPELRASASGGCRASAVRSGGLGWAIAIGLSLLLRRRSVLVRSPRR